MDSAGDIDITIIIPTRDRRRILLEALRRLDAQVTDPATFEVMVVDDGSTDGSAGAVRAERWGFAVTVLEQESSGTSVARNRAMELARGRACLFLNDDSWPAPDLVARHVGFHRAAPEPHAALLGRVVTAPDPPPSPFMVWFDRLHFGFSGMDPADAGGGRFYTANVSAKTSLLRAAGGFDEDFREAAEDIDLGLRLEANGMRLAYDADARVEHHHPVDLERALRRFVGIGRASAQLDGVHPGRPVPRPPDARHRVKAAALTVLALAGVRTRAVRHETWRFLCHEAHREGFWDAAPAAGEPVPRVGRRLAALAARDPATALPESAVVGVADDRAGS